MKALEERWKDLIVSPFIERTAELAELRHLLAASRHRAVVIEGAAGTGKTMLASQFAKAFADDFPGGVQYRSGWSNIGRSLELGGGPALLVLDGLDEVSPDHQWAIPFLRDALGSRQDLYALITTRPKGDRLEFDRLAIKPLDGPSIVEMFRTALGSDVHPPQALIDLADGNPLIASLLVKMVGEWGDLAGVVEALRSFSRPGLVDVYGAPLNVRSNAGKRFITDVREVNDFILKLVEREPDTLFQLPPRRFEEICAELFERLGYTVELTPAINDGGKDLIIVKRSDIGTVLTFVECKKYSPTDPVGVEVIRALNGVVEAGRATSGLVMTTSRFTRGAKKLQGELQYRMSLADYGEFKKLLGQALGGDR
ncbi:restriction endonuclease [Ensifer adhaerens]|uniref:restriction endonuclease n=1 Tax=Ensifer adhaerens TaxID=106592 RepID=UPI000CF14189|nr:restriction endonuclease [Ensifer adhaerens]